MLRKLRRPRLYYRPCPDAMPIEVEAWVIDRQRGIALVVAQRGKPFFCLTGLGPIRSKSAAVRIETLEIQHVRA